MLLFKHNNIFMSNKVEKTFLILPFTLLHLNSSRDPSAPNPDASGLGTGLKYVFNRWLGKSRFKI